METGTSLGLTLVVVGCLVVGVFFGAISAAIFPPERVERRVAFGWGWALGPIGVGVALILRAQANRSATGPAGPF